MRELRADRDGDRRQVVAIDVQPASVLDAVPVLEVGGDRQSAHQQGAELPVGVDDPVVVAQRHGPADAVGLLADGRRIGKQPALPGQTDRPLVDGA